MKSILIKKLKPFQIFIAILLIFGSLFPPTRMAIAQEVNPPSIEESSAGDAPAEEPATEPSSVEEPAEAYSQEAPVEETAADTGPAFDSRIPESEVGEETPEFSEPEDLTDLINVMQENDTVLVTEEGEVMPLASQDAVTALSTASDPWFAYFDPDLGVEVRVGYVFPDQDCDMSFITECHKTATPVKDAVDDDRSTNNTINITAGYYGDTVTISKPVFLQATAIGENNLAVIENFILNTDISGWLNILGNTIFINPGAFIQDGIDIVQTGGSVQVAEGVFAENVVIDKSLELSGAGSDLTVLHPEVSNPDCAGAGSDALCPGGSSVIVVRASDVTIRDLTVNGNNPNLTSGIVVNGEDVDGRNGIIVDGVYNNLEVYNTKIANFYLRGIHASQGGTFNVHDNYLENINGDPAHAIALMNWNGAGIFQNNRIVNSNDGIVLHWSRGTQVFDNRIENVAGAGIYTEHYGPDWGSAPLGPEVIRNNLILNSPNGYGIYVFSPYGEVLVDQNRIENVKVALSASGGHVDWTGAGGSSVFSKNYVDGSFNPDSIGAFITTHNILGGGYSPVSTYFLNNLIMNNGIGFYLLDEALGPTGITFDAYHNAIVWNTKDAVNESSSMAMMQDNWWNDNNGPQNLEGGDLVNWFQWLKLGLNTDPSTINTWETSHLTSYLYSTGDWQAAPVSGLWWFNPLDVVNAEETSLGQVDNNIYQAFGQGGLAAFSSQFFGKIFSSLGFVEILGSPDNGGGSPLPSKDGSPNETGLLTAGLIPVTGGMFELSCATANTLTLANGSSVLFSAPLCGYQARLDDENNGSLPAPLPDELSFASGLTLSLIKDGGAVSPLPEPVTGKVRFVVPEDLAGKTLVILSWDSSTNGGLGGWVEVPSTSFGEAEFTVPGTFVLAY